jgi:hypothetical protein
MKLVLWVLLHALCAVVGFSLVSGETYESAEKTTAASEGPKSKVAVDVHTFQPPPKIGSEAGMAVLSYENWAEAIHPISQMSLEELPAMLRGLLRNPFPEVRRRLLRYLFERWASLDLNGALTTLRGLSSPQDKESAMRAALDFWVKTDADAALNWLGTLHDDSVLQEAGIGVVLYRKAAKDPLTSAAWADQIEDAFLREKVLAQIGLSWMSEDVAGVLAALPTVEPKRLRDQLLAKLCYRNGVDHAAGLEIVSQLPTHAERSHLSDEWLSGFLNDKPLEAFEWLRAHSERPELQKAADTVGGHLGATVKNGAELHAMAVQLPAGPIRDAFTARAVEQWILAGRSVPEAQALLSLCGPCIERESAQETIDSRRTTP